MIATSANRVSSQTDPVVNRRIASQTERNLAYFERHPEEIENRLDELDREWDVERVLQTMAPTVTLLGIFLTVVRSRKFLVLPIAVQSFFMMHALQGWCPPLPVLRRLGFRTQYEIEEERYALKALQA